MLQVLVLGSWRLMRKMNFENHSRHDVAARGAGVVVSASLLGRLTFSVVCKSLNRFCCDFSASDLPEFFMEVAVKNILAPHFGDCNPCHLAKLMFCTITKLYTFCYTFSPQFQ